MFTRSLMLLRSHCSRSITASLFQYVALPRLLSKLPRTLYSAWFMYTWNWGFQCPWRSTVIYVLFLLCRYFRHVYLLYMSYSTELCLKKITLYMFWQDYLKVFLWLGTFTASGEPSVHYFVLCNSLCVGEKKQLFSVDCIILLHNPFTGQV